MIRIIVAAGFMGLAGILTAAPAAAEPASNVSCAPCEEVRNLPADFAAIPGELLLMPGQVAKDIQDLPAAFAAIPGELAAMPGQTAENIRNLPGDFADNVRDLAGSE